MGPAKPNGKEPPQTRLSRPTADTLMLAVEGSWRLSQGAPSIAEVTEEIEKQPPVRHVAFDTSELEAWDSSLLRFLADLFDYCAGRDIVCSKDGLPQGVVRLLELAAAVPEQKDARKASRRASFLNRVGTSTLEFAAATGEMLAFIGETFLAFSKMLYGKARFRRTDLTLLIQETGVQALPIVSLISLLVGLILAFVGAIQLRLFGAQIYVADLVGLGMAREMGAMMTAVIVAGRTGAAFAAQLGSMQVNEEIDALKTLGISPMEFLVLPRMLALVLMLPLLCLYADLMGILGGAIVGVGMLHLSLVEYCNETRAAVHLFDFTVGLIKSGVFGVLVAMAGCLRGMQCGRSSAAVGEAATSAVVTAIVAIVVSDAILTVLYDILGV